MPNSCVSVHDNIFPYLDGELPDPELREFESHLGDCATCRELFCREEESHRALQSHLQSLPCASEFLSRKIRAALDREDMTNYEHARGVRSLSLPGIASAIAAAALLLFVWNDLSLHEVSSNSEVQPGRVTREVARQHLEGTPLFVSNDRSMVTRSAKTFLNAPVRAPRFYSRKVKLLGWTPAQVGGRQSATFIYKVRGQAGLHRVLAHAVVLADVDLRLQRRITTAAADLWIDSAYGFNTVTYIGQGPLAYVFSSDMSVDSLVAMVAGTDTVNTIGP